MTAAIIIPFRDRGTDPLRAANLARAVEHWNGFEAPCHVISDGGAGSEQFNRSRAHNIGAATVDAEVIVYAEADVLVPHSQIRQAIQLAAGAPGLVLPYLQVHTLSAADSRLLRAHRAQPGDCEPEGVFWRGVGAIGVASRAALATAGRWDEAFAGSWYDDSAMERAFAVCAGPTRWVHGPGVASMASAGGLWRSPHRR